MGIYTMMMKAKFCIWLFKIHQLYTLTSSKQLSIDIVSATRKYFKIKNELISDIDLNTLDISWIMIDQQ